MNNHKGITLIALVITIIVLLILAGVSISMVIGDNGILTQAGNAKENTERTKVEEAMKLAYNAANTEILSGSTTKTIEELTVEELEKQGYDVKKLAATTETITGVSLTPNPVTLKVGDTAKTITIEYETESSSATNYYMLVNGEYYELTINSSGITLAETPTDIDNLEGAENETKAEVSSTDTAEEVIQMTSEGNTITVTPVAKGTATITVTYGEYTAECEVNVSAEVKIGNFINYNVTYKDAYFGYEYNATNGWRYIGDDGDGNHLIISTGIPATLQYNYNNPQDWWDAATDSSGNTVNANVRMTNGLKNNFENVSLTGTVNDSTTVTGASFATGDATGVTTLATLPTGWASLTGDSEGLYDLNDLKNLTNMTGYDYNRLASENSNISSDITWYWWLAYPNAGNNSSVYIVYYASNMSNFTGTSSGVRPVVSLPSTIDLSSLVVE